MPLRLRRYDRVEPFLADVGAFLVAREAEHNLILGLCSGLLRTPALSDGPPLLAAATGDRGVVGVALRTPPNNLILSEIDDPAAVPLLADAGGEALPGVTGPPDAARACAAQWAWRTGRPWRVGLEERIYRLVTLRPHRSAPGGWRLAVSGDRGLLAAWLASFRREALGERDVDEEVARRLDDWESGGSGRRFWVWEDGAPVALVGAGGETPNGIRIGPVYTPPELRGRGYATNLTAAVSGAMLAEGRRFCFLYTDLANPTSNRIYQAIGYEPVTDALVVRFASG